MDADKIGLVERLAGYLRCFVRQGDVGYAGLSDDITNSIYLITTQAAQIVDHERDFQVAVAEVSKWAQKAGAAEAQREELVGALDALVIESGGKAIPNENLTIARDQALAALSRVKP